MDFLIIIHHIPQEETSSPDLAASLLNLFHREIFGKAGQDFLSSCFPTYFHCSLNLFLLLSVIVQQQTEPDPACF